MIQVDISNIWGEVSLPDLLMMEKEVFDAHAMLMEGTGPGSKHLGWLKLPEQTVSNDLTRIQEAAQRIRDNSDILVVVGIGGSYLGAKAAIELLQGANRNLSSKPQIFYAGNTLSTRAWEELTGLLEDRDFSIVIISKSGTTMEPAIATRNLCWLMERKYGTDEAKTRIYAITDPCSGALRQMAEEAGWETFSIPKDVGGRFSVLTAAGLLPMAAAGIDIQAVLRGAAEGREAYDLRSFENPVWLYSTVRNVMYRKGKAIELLESFEPGFRSFGAWWQQLFGESEGKDGKGLFPTYAELTADLHSLGQLIQQGQRNLFETMLRFAPPEKPHLIGSDVRNLDNLNYLAGKFLDQVEEQAFFAAINAHVDGGVPVITMDCGRLDDRKVGELFYFLELCCAISGYILGVNPFNQPGMEQYRTNLFRLLGKPGY